MMKRWLAAAAACVFLLVGCGGNKESDPPVKAPEQGRVEESVPESAPETVPESKPESAPESEPEIEELPALCETWYTRAPDGDGILRAMELSLWYNGTAEYRYGIPDSDVLEAFEGQWSEADGTLTLELHGGPVDSEGKAVAGDAYDTLCSLAWSCGDGRLSLRHVGGDPLLYDTVGAEFDFLTFDSGLLAGTWSADAIYRDWIYDLSLQEDGACLFKISEAGEELALYRGRWFMSDDSYVSLDLSLSSGQHPESPEMEQISGTYLAERNGRAMDFSFVSGGILTLNMEETGSESFLLASGGSCVSVYAAADISVSRDDCDWVIVDDTEPVEAAFCTMVPVENFAVVSLSMRESGSELTFEATELFDYGTLTPERPLLVTLTVYGTIPSYGVTFTDPNGAHRLFGVTVSGVDGSLELVELW